MPIWLKNFQRTVMFNESLFKMHCCFLLNAFGAGRFETSVVCIDDERMRQLNMAFRNEDTPTDILSFPYYEDIQPGGALPTPSRECDYNLGDIIIGMPYVSVQCKQERVNLMDRLSILVTHGLSHLLGYTHESLEDTKLMISKEKAILTSYNNTFGTNLETLTSFE